MRNKGSALVLEHQRQLAVRRVLEGYSVEEVADFLDVDGRSVRRWVAMVRQQGWDALAAQPVPGRPRKLTRTQEKIMLGWLRENPTAFGFTTELWTAARLAQLAEEEWGVSLHPRSLRRWLRSHNFTLQKPERVPRERDPQRIADWLATQWPRIKKKRIDNVRLWC
jgi:transposase